ncbi:unnamed protein product [Ilex paraguariensis]|uniref:Uncharacterized protein n=1 Tax=Ilex paraguariensis TaxID=185542 RepID=A0ABC8U5P3_9AQUA
MSEDVVAKDKPSNSCCAMWDERYSKLQQKYTKLEERRNALRTGVGMLKQQLDQIETEKLNLKQGV